MTGAAYRLAFGVVKHFPFGGMQRNFLRIAEECARRGPDVHLFTGAWTGPKPTGLEVEVLEVRARTNHGRNLKFGEALRAAVAASRFDCIIGSNRLRDLDVYYAGDPCYAAQIAEDRSGLVRLLPRYRAYLRQEADVFARGLDTEILLTAHQEQEKFVRHYRTEADRFHLLPPGIDRARLLAGRPTAPQRAAIRTGLGVGEGDLMLLSVGSGFRTKGVDRSLRAIAGLPPGVRRRCRLIVVGQGKAAPFRRLARRLGLASQVTFAGPRSELAGLYHSADLLLHPARRENTGNALIEAMVCGLPVLATAACGFASHVEHADAGLTCPSPFSAADLSRLLLTMLGSEERERWSRNAASYTLQMDLDSMAERAADAILARAEANRLGAGVRAAVAGA